MSRKAPELNPHQGSLVTIAPNSAINHTESFPTDPPEKLLGDRPYPVVYGEPGSYVDIAERARHLTNALTAFATINRLSGFDAASNSRQYARPIYERYTWNTDSVQANASAKSKRKLQEAKREFWQATGYPALRGSGLVPDREIDASGRLLWTRFGSQYSGPGQAVTRRDNYRRKLSKNTKITQKVINQAAA